MSDGKKIGGNTNASRKFRVLLSICRSAIVRGPRDPVPRPRPRALLLEKSRWPPKDSQLSSHSITASVARSFPPGRFCNRGQHKSSRREKRREPHCAHKTAYDEETRKPALLSALPPLPFSDSARREGRVTAGNNANTLFNYSAPTFAINLEIDRGPIAGLARRKLYEI